jgi:hypothetical protein
VNHTGRILRLKKAIEARARARPAENLSPEQNRRWVDLKLVFHRVHRAVPPERRARFVEVIITDWRSLIRNALARKNPNAVNAGPAPINEERDKGPAVSFWLFGMTGPTRAWFPDPIPLAWLDAVLDIPQVEIYFGCTRCGFEHPNYPTSGPELGPWVRERPVFETCTYCGGPVEWSGGKEYNCTRQLPLLGEELRAGRDPCADYALPHVSATPGVPP